MVTVDEKLSPKQEKALGSLLTHSTIAEAAQDCGISEPTLWRWLREPKFKAEYSRLRNRLIESALDRLSRICNAAIETLEHTLTDESAPATAKVAAASKILHLTLKLRETVEIEDRLRSIEEQIGKQK
jgi:DNA-binding MurR/RpiR family transcriptional regulator